MINVTDAFLYIGGMAYLAPWADSSDEVRRTIQLYHYKLGVQSIIVPWIVCKGFPFDSDSSGYAWVGSSTLGMGGVTNIALKMLDAIMDECGKLGMTVRIGLAETFISVNDLYSNQYMTHVAAQMNALAAQICEQRYGDLGHFIGFYLCDEPADCDSGTIDFAINIARAVRMVSKRPLCYSPFLGWNSHAKTPPAEIVAKVRNWKSKVEAVAGPIDLFMQDSVGACAASIGGLGDEPTVQEYFGALGDLVERNNETSCYGEHDANTGGTPAPSGIIRYVMQIQQTNPGNPSRKTKGYSWHPAAHFVEAKGAEPEAGRACAEFQAAFGLAGKIHYPSRYEYLHQPDPNHTDITMGQLTRGRPGTPFGLGNFNDRAWIGIQGNFYVRLYFDFEINVSYVSGDFLQNLWAGIGLPHTFSVSKDLGVQGSWIDIGTPAARYLPSGKVGNCVVSNHQKLGWTRVKTIDVWAAKLDNHVAQWLMCCGLVVTGY